MNLIPIKTSPRTRRVRHLPLAPNSFQTRLIDSFSALHRRFISRLLLALCFAGLPVAALAGTPSPYVTHTVPSALTSQVNALVTSATNQQQQLRAATLQWALNEAASQFVVTSSTVKTPQGMRSLDATTSLLASDTTTVAAPSGVAPAGTYDYQYSPFGIGDLLVADVQTNLSNNTLIGSQNSAEYPLGYNFFPKIPNYPAGSGTQPVNALAKGAFGNIVNNINSGSMSDGNRQVTEAFGHLDSPYLGDYRLVPIIFNSLEHSFEWWMIYADSADNFPVAGSYTLEYLDVVSRFPDLVLPSCMKRWEASTYYQMSLYYAYNASSSGITATSPVPDKTFLLGDPGRAYPNSDFRVCEGMYYASIIFSSPLNANNYPSAVATNLRAAVYSYFDMALSEAILFGDGGFTYSYGSNEVSTYQEAETAPLGNLFQISKPLTGGTDAAARATLETLLEDSRLYYPIQYPSANYTGPDAEYPAWKQGFARPASYAVGGGLIYNMIPELSTSSDAQMWRVYDETSIASPQNLDLIGVSCIDTSKDPFHGSVASAQQADPDDFFLYDENLEGPNIRIGNWTATGSARMVHTDGRGVASIAGCIAQATSSTPKVEINVLSNVIQTSGTVIYTGTAARGFVNTYTSDCQNSTIVQPTFATIAGEASIRPHSGSTLPFATAQEWIYTPSRMVGLSTLIQTSTTSQTEYGVGGWLTGSGTAITLGSLPTLGAGLYSGSNYVVTTAVKEDTYGNYIDGKSGVAVLVDTATPVARTYVPGVVGHYVVDIHLTAAGNADSAKSINTGISGLYALEVKEGPQMYRLIHNTTGSPITYTAALSSSDWGTGSVIVHNAYTPPIYGSTSDTPPVPSAPEVPGETYRPAWVSTNGIDSFSSTTPVYVALASGTVTYTVPANSHILMTNPQNLVDGAVYELEPSYAPGTRLDVTGKGTADGTKVELWQRNGGLNQKWQAELQLDGTTFKLFPLHAQGSNLAVSGNGTANQTQVVINGNSAATGQYWTPTLQTNGCIELAPLCAPNSVMEVFSKGTANGSQVEIWQDGHWTNQRWRLFRENPVPGVQPN